MYTGGLLLEGSLGLVAYVRASLRPRLHPALILFLPVLSLPLRQPPFRVRCRSRILRVEALRVSDMFLLLFLLDLLRDQALLLLALLFLLDLGQRQIRLEFLQFVYVRDEFHVAGI